MRLLLDQMIDTSVAEELRNEEYDILCASEAGMARADDLEILKYCIQKKRILVTLDEHFGDWTVAKLTRHTGVIRLKVNPTTTSNIKRVLYRFLKNNREKDFKNILVIVKSNGIRWISTV